MAPLPLLNPKTMFNFNFLNKTFHRCVEQFKDHHHHHTRPSQHLNSICIPTSTSNSIFFSSDTDTSDETSTVTSPPDFATVFASQRFFFSSPGPSNSIFNTKLLPAECDTLIAGGVPTPTYSPNPYLDFRRSMQEMVDSKSPSLEIKADWDWLHELLLCYLALNPKCTHKYVLEAFSDLLVSLMTHSSSSESDTHLLEAEIPDKRKKVKCV